MLSVVIPARNEGYVIARSLRAIVTSAAPGELDVIVVCNGCTDDTAAVARSFGPPVRVIETEVGSKTHALNLGDKAASAFPRIYVDADVVVTVGALRILAARLGRGDVLAVAPQPQINLIGCSWFVRAYYEIRSLLPSAREGIGGSGVYAVCHAGREKFGEFPHVTADDGYVRIQFKTQERATVAEATSVVFAPRKIRDLIRIRTRAYFGTKELARRYPNLWENSGERNHKAIFSLLGSPSLWVKLPIYCYVNIVARYKAASRLDRMPPVWEQDYTSRKALVGTDITGEQHA